ncbi:Uma2 family endonuclease [Micromonospora sp. NPDC057141]|uniref:Uma2 family endonuclease n=1 Tax=Micromonospora sp. NPDC057141 TaxID=3346033 RepID=UPI003631E619
MDGALVFTMSPQRVWHARMVTALVNRLTEQAPPGIEVDREITIRLDRWNRPEPDLLATVEVVSPESAHRDRAVKLPKYAEAGIANYWRIEEEAGSPVVHAYEFDGPPGRTCRPESIDVSCAPRRRSRSSSTWMG